MTSLAIQGDDMHLAAIQQLLQEADAQTPYPFRSAAEIVVTMTEELGEVVTEVSLLERIGTKAEWSKEPSTDSLAKELLHLMNMIVVLANRYAIDLDQAYNAYLQQIAGASKHNSTS
jgi:NTP pyrophosphatase (non-canonical NTP hydrolase)